ncbi:MAG: nuclear transport factor 2 family protein [Bacteroidota bacterium]
MKKISLLFVLLLILGKVYSANDEEQVKQVILDAYVNGIQNKGSLEDIEKGFHPSFELIGIGKDGYTVWENHIYTWKERVRQYKEENPGNVQEPVSCEFESIDITGDACIAKIKLFKDGKQLFTDYLSLYKFKDGWRIVSKIFYRH